MHTHLTPAEVVKRIALPFFVFAAVLTALLMLSWVLLIPRLTTVEVSGVERNLDELHSYTKQLQAKISLLEGQRSTFLFPSAQDTYSRLKAVKLRRNVYQKFRTELDTVIRKAVPDQNNAIIVSSFYYDALSRTIRLTGDVRNSGTRSMTVLAGFIKHLEQLPMTLSIDASRFTRLEDPVKGYYSPFTLVILLDHELMGN